MEIVTTILVIAGLAAAWADVRSGSMEHVGYLALPLVGAGITYAFR